MNAMDGRNHDNFRQEKPSMNRFGIFTVGLVICAILGVIDVVGLVGLTMKDGPPAAVPITGAVLGLLTLAAVGPARAGQRRGTIAVIASRGAAAVLGAPAFFVDSAPDWAQLAVAITIVLTVIGVGLLAVSMHRTGLSTAQS